MLLQSIVVISHSPNSDTRASLICSCGQRVNGRRQSSDASLDQHDRACFLTIDTSSNILTIYMAHAYDARCHSVAQVSYEASMLVD
jgi:hypothetical protein